MLRIQRNLVNHGGWLDEVLWVVNTENKDDLRYLNKLLSRSERYKKLDLGKKVKGPEFRQIWKHLERGKLYVKVDDDVVSASQALPLTQSHILIVDTLIRFGSRTTQSLL